MAKIMVPQPARRLSEARSEAKPSELAKRTSLPPHPGDGSKGTFMRLFGGTSWLWWVSLGAGFACSG